jgi:hypothetical protein
MYKFLLFVIISLSIFSQISCDAIAPKDFEAYAQKFVAEYRPLFPDESPLSMDNEFLGRLAIPTPTYLDSVRDFQKSYAAEWR